MDISKLYDTKKHLFSFEIFPPKLTSSFETISGVVNELSSLAPDFISVTYGAGGSVKDNRTVELCRIIKQNNTCEPVAHLTCVGATKSEISQLLSELKATGISNILALRGDKNQNVTKDGDFMYASELIEYIKDNYGDDFHIMAACYPAGHAESLSLKDDILNLKRKVKAGASGLITQMFFDNDEFYKFRDLIEVADVNVPIEAGIMPITNTRQIERIISLSGATMPSRLSRLIARYGANDTAMFDAGIAFAIEQIIELLSEGINGIHLYTMNNPKVAYRVYDSIKGLLSF